MSIPARQSVGGIDAGVFGEARRQAHNAVQWLSRMAHSYMPPAAGNAHLLLPWDGDRHAFVTREFLPDLTLELRLPGLEMQFRESGQPMPHVLAMDDRTPAEVEAWVLVELLHRRLDRDRFSKALPYGIPDLMTGDSEAYRTRGIEPALAELTKWLADAASLIERAVGQDRRAAGLPVAVHLWPETFRLEALLPAGAPGGSSGKGLRVGFSPGDALYAEPYFFVTPHDPGRTAGIDPGDIMAAAELSPQGQASPGALDVLAQRIAAH